MAAVRRRERDVVEENCVTPTVKRRKMQEEKVDVVESRIIQATNRGGIVERNSAGASEMSVVIIRRRDSPPVEESGQCQIEQDLDRTSSVSCCSSNYRSEEKSKRRIEFVDIDQENNGDDETGTSWIYDNFNKRNDSYSEESEVNMEIQASEDVESRRRSKKMIKKKKKNSCDQTVKEAELEDFFQAAEKNLRNKMVESSMKYNFDFEKEEPISGGRYEWVKLNP